MDKLLTRLKDFLKRYRARKFNTYVKKVYKENKSLKIEFENNIWNKNEYWDHYFHGFKHSIKSKLYVPYDYYNYKILPNLNDVQTKAYVQDKNMFDKIFGNSGVLLPRTIFRCMNYIFLDSKYEEIVNIENFIGTVKEDMIVKPIVDSGGGAGIKLFQYKNGRLENVIDGSSLDVHALRTELGGNFIVQEVIKQHENLAQFHPSSLNTIKVLTYRSVKTNEVDVLLSYFRTGVNKSYVDSASSGGIAVGIEVNKKDYSAKLRKYGVLKFGDELCTRHPDSDIEFHGKEMFNFYQIFKSARKLSNIVPYQRLIGWDFSVNEAGKPVLIEANYGSNIAGLQAANGLPLFGEYSNEVKEYLDS